MKALQLTSVGCVELVERDPPAPAADELLVRTGAALICTSDLNDIRENPFDISLPVILGHEAAGTVAAVGARVAGFRVGDRVATHPVHPCSDCPTCRAGMTHLCENMGHFGLNRQGTFAEQFTVRQDRARTIPDSLPFQVAALAEPVAVCLEALAQARLRECERLLVIGDGPFGILTARLARRQGIQQIIIAGHHHFRLSLATGAEPVNTKAAGDAAGMLLGRSGGAGYDAVILATGNRRACQEALGLLRSKGRLVVFSAIAGETPLDLFRVHMKELEIVGACNDQDRLDDAVACLLDPQLALDELITSRFSLDRYREALGAAASRHDECVKAAFVFEETTP